MIKCVNCKGDAEKYGPGILVSPDGDFVCSEECEKEFITKREEFFNNIHDDDYFTDWWDAID
jgi:hypothetical protein